MRKQKIKRVAIYNDEKKKTKMKIKIMKKSTIRLLHHWSNIKKVLRNISERNLFRFHNFCLQKNELANLFPAFQANYYKRVHLINLRKEGKGRVESQCKS